MDGDRHFWVLFGGLWLFIGGAFLAVSAGVVFIAGGKSNDGAPLWPFVLAGLAASAFGGFVLCRTRVAAARQRRLMRSGIRLPATVTDSRESLVKINRQPRWHVCYCYDYAGRSFTRESAAMPGESVADFKPGERVAVMVDPLDPQDSLFIGRA